jgi:hypothetical protein
LGKLADIEARVNAAVADDLLTEQEEQQLDRYVPSVGLTWDAVWKRYPGLAVRILVAKTNDGRLETLPNPQVIPKQNETVHIEVPASLLKEHAIREYKGGYSGFSFPIGKTGIRYRVGGIRGHSEVVGTGLQEADSGILSVTSQRAVFLGGRKTMDMPYARLVGVNVFGDGIQFHLSNRQAAPLFRLAHGDVIAAIIHVAMQRGTPSQSSSSV